MEQTNFSNRLKKVEEMMVEIRKNMIDADSIMTEEDYASLLEYRKEKGAGKLISHQAVKKELGV